MNRLYLFVFPIFMLTQTNTAKPSCQNVLTSHKPGDTYIISISSMWSEYDLPTFNMGAFYQHLTLLARVWSYSGSINQNEIGFISFDVCDNKTLLTEVITTLLLEQSYLVSANTPIPPDNQCFCLESTQSILAIFGNMEDDMLKLTANLLLPANIPFFGVNKNILFPDSETSHPYFIPIGDIISEENEFGLFFKHFQWEKINLLCLQCDLPEVERSFERLWKYLITVQNYPICVTYHKQNKTEIKSVIEKIQTNNKSEIFVVASDFHDGLSNIRLPQYDLLKSFQSENITGKVLFLYEYKNIYGLETAYHKFPRHLIHGLFTIKNFIMNLGRSYSVPTTYLNEEANDLKNDKWIKKYLSFHPNSSDTIWVDVDQHERLMMYLQVIFHRTILMFRAIDNIEEVKNVISQQLQHNIRFYNQNTTGETYHQFYFDNSQQKVFKSNNIPERLSWPNFETEPPIVKCNKRICPPGWQNEIGTLKDYETVWQMEYGWTCVRCKKNTFKSSFGTGTCQPCTGLLVANVEKNSCYNPYKKEYMHSFGTGVMISLCVATTGFLWTVFVIIVIYKHKKTPCVRSADLLMTTLQLLSLLCFFVIFPSLLIMPPTKLSCISQSCFVGITLTFSISITLSKTQKLLFAFQAKRKLSKKMIMITKATEIFILTVFIVIDVLLQIVTLIQQEVKVVEEFNPRTLQQYVYCNTDHLLQVQFVFMLLLSIACNIQGYRARQLPSNYNETKFVLYATLMLSLCLAIMFPLNYSERNPIIKLTISLLMVLLGMTIFVVILYASKMYIILFRTELNTTAVFRRMLMDNAKKQVVEETRKRERKKRETKIRDSKKLAKDSKKLARDSKKLAKTKSDPVQNSLQKVKAIQSKKLAKTKRDPVHISFKQEVAIVDNM